MKSEIWAIGGGKGGTGKSVITSTLGLCLAKQGKKVTLIDADLGGANLHSFLKIKKPKKSLPDFFEKKYPLKEIIVKTGTPNLQLIVGDINTFNPNSIKYTQKLKFFRHIISLNSDFILIDLGAGTHLNTIDSFLLADKKIVVTVPEITSIENLYNFIKKVLFRKINRILHDHKLKDAAHNLWKNRDIDKITNIKTFINYLKNSSDEIKNLIDKELMNFEINIIINQIRNPNDIETGFSIKSLLIKYLGMDVRFSGYIKYFDSFRDYYNGDKKHLSDESDLSTPLFNEDTYSLVNNLVDNNQLNLFNP
jgi:flagellar biosynthesis protein FlhG